MSSTKGVPKEIQKNIKKFDAETIWNTFDSNVGLISNLALRLGEAEYNDGYLSVLSKKKKKDEVEELKKELKDSAVMCEILTGLEIDACKKGEHPSLDEINELGTKFEKIKGKQDDFINLKKKIDGISHFNHSYVAKEGEGYSLGAESEFFIVRKPSPELPNIEKLPWYCAEKLNGLNETENQKVSSTKVEALFTFGESKEFDEEKAKKLAEILAGYKEAKKQLSKFSKERKFFVTSKDYWECLSSLICQYGVQEYVYKDSKETVEELLLDAFDAIRQAIKDCGTTARAVKKRFDEFEKTDDRWSYTPIEKREEFIRNLFDGKLCISSYSMEILTNFRHNGYNILLNILEDLVYQEKRTAVDEDPDNEDKPVEYTEAYEDKDDEDEDEKIGPEVSPDDKYVELVTRMFNERKESSNIKGKLKAECHKDILELFNFDEKEALRYTYRKNKEAFWTMFSWDDMKEYVKGAEVQ